MSCQSVIDKSLSKEGKFQRTITVIGESGDAFVPERCAVTFLECKIGKLTIDNYSTVVVCRSEVSGKVEQIDGVFTADRVTFQEAVEFISVKATEKECTHLHSFILREGSTLDAVKTNRPGVNGDWGVKVVEGSRALLIDDTIPAGFPCAVEVDSSSSVVIRNSKIIGIDDGIRAFGTSRVEMMGGELQGENQYALHAKDGSEVLLTSIPKPVLGQRAAIRTEESAQVRVTNTPILTSPETAIYADTKSSVQVYRFDKIVGEGNAAVRVEQEASVTVAKGDKIQSDGAEAIRMSREAVLTATDVTTILSNASHGIATDQGCSVTLRNISSRIIGMGGDGIKAGTNDTFHISSCPQLRGQAGNAVSSSSGSSFFFVSVDDIQGMQHTAFLLGDSNTVSCQKSTLIKGVQYSGIIAGSRLNLTLVDVTTVQGFLRDGIVAGSESIIRCADVDEILGMHGRGIVLGSRSDLELANCGRVVAWEGDAIDAPSSRVVARTVEKIESPTIGEGIQVDGSGGVVRLSNVGRVHAEEGDAIRVTKGQLTVERCGRITGGGAGINLQNKATAQIHTLDRLFGGDVGLKIHDHSRAEASAVDSWEGGGEGGIGAKKSVVVAQAIGELIGAPRAVIAEDASSVTVQSAEVAGDILVDAESSCKLSDCDVTGGAEATDSLLDFARVNLTKDVVITDSVLQFLRGEIGGLLTATGSGLSVHKVEIAGAPTLTASGGLFTKCTSPPIVLADGGALAAGCDMGEAVVVGASWIHASAAEAFVRSELLVRLMADEILQVTT